MGGFMKNLTTNRHLNLIKSIIILFWLLVLILNFVYINLKIISSLNISNIIFLYYIFIEGTFSSLKSISNLTGSIYNSIKGGIKTYKYYFYCSLPTLSIILLSFLIILIRKFI